MARQKALFEYFNDLNSKQVGILVSVLLIILILLLAIVERKFGSSGINLMNIYFNIVLTSALVALYHRQSEIQRSQTELMERQQKLVKSSERPILQVERYRPAHSGESRYSTSALEVMISNIGDSSAMDLEIEFVTGFPSDLPFSAGRSVVSLRKTDEVEGWFREWGENLEANTREIVYIGEPLMVAWYDEEEEETREKALEFLSSQDSELENVENIRIKANLQYKGLEETHKEPIFDYLVPLQAYGGMRAALENGRRYNDSTGYEITDPIYEHEWT